MINNKRCWETSELLLGNHWSSLNHVVLQNKVILQDKTTIKSTLHKIKEGNDQQSNHLYNFNIQSITEKDLSHCLPRIRIKRKVAPSLISGRLNKRLHIFCPCKPQTKLSMVQPSSVVSVTQWELDAFLSPSILEHLNVTQEYKRPFQITRAF